MGQLSRQDNIVAIVKEKGYVTIDELASQFAVTPQTIRRDINELAKADLIRRHHGGASYDSSTTNVAYATRQILQLPAKEQIAKRIAAEIPNNASSLSILVPLRKPLHEPYSTIKAYKSSLIISM